MIERALKGDEFREKPDAPPMQRNPSCLVSAFSS